MKWTMQTGDFKKISERAAKWPRFGMIDWEDPENYGIGLREDIPVAMFDRDGRIVDLRSGKPAPKRASIQWLSPEQSLTLIQE